MIQLNLFGPAEKTVVFDLETQRSFQDVGGREKMHLLGLSVGVLYDYNSQRFYSFFEADASRLVDELLSATKVIGFNIEQFDYPVLTAYRPDVNFKKIPTLDLLKEFTRMSGFRIGLDNLAQATLGVGKSADGLVALKWFKEGRLDLIEKYCRDDVDVTRRLYEFGRDHTFVKYREKRTGEIVSVPVDWT